MVENTVKTLKSLESEEPTFSNKFNDLMVNIKE
jgi:hypothetical protein